jgi:hypothetical protein
VSAENDIDKESDNFTQRCETRMEHVNVLVAKERAHADLRKSNICRRESNCWRMVDHHLLSDVMRRFS